MKRRIVALLSCVLVGIFATGCANTEMEAPALPDNTFKISFSIDPDRYISLGFNPAEGTIDFSGKYKLRNDEETTTEETGTDSENTESTSEMMGTAYNIVNDTLINGVGSNTQTENR